MRFLASVLLYSSLVQLAVVEGTFPFANSRFRTMNGDDRDDHKGRAHELLARIVTPANYPGDGSGETIEDEFNPRTITNFISSQSSQILNERKLSAMVWQFGQLLDHDFGISHGAIQYGEANIPCVDSNDLFKDAGCEHIGFTRTEFTGSPREHFNDITAFIDASFVYGSDEDRMSALRTHVNGEMKMSTGTAPNRQLLPYNFADNPLDNAGGNSTSFFVSGDVRANEQLGLTCMHTLFAREHNRLCEIIKAEWGGTDDEIFQTARKIVGAQMQIIVYKEWLPALMGEQYAPRHIHTDDDKDPSMLTEFTTAAFRMGHSMLHDSITLGFDKLSTTSLPLRNAFFNPRFLSTNPANVDLIIMGLIMDQAQEVDVRVTDEIRNFLFAENGRTACLDLAALNIQRGRDHGLADYNSVRVAMGMSAKSDFFGITSDLALARALHDAYQGQIDKVDLWVGVLAEDHLPGSSLGELAIAIFRMQFEALRDGDPMYYTRDNDFTTPEMRQIFDVNTFTFAQLLRDNTDIPNVPPNPFFVSPANAETCGALGTITMELTDSSAV